MEALAEDFWTYCKEIIIRAIKMYFLPLKGARFLAYELTNHVDKSDALVPINAINVLRDTICLNQGLFSEYWFLASQSHKDLRVALEDEPKSPRKIKRLHYKLVKELNAEFFEAAAKNFELLHNYFDERSKRPPRICLKGIFNKSDKEQIITILRDRPYEADSETEVTSNAGFASVTSSGIYYLCNDLPKAVMSGYENPRLDVEKIKSASFFERTFWMESNWDRYWKSSTTPNDDASAYKSTLIVPLTFWNNDVNPRFLNALDILPKSKRTILGFLCIDHVDRHYFSEELDVSVAYMYADFLAMFLFARLVFMDMSKNFQLSSNYLDNRKQFELDQKSLRKLIEIINQRHEVLTSVTQINKSERDENHLVTLDMGLAKSGEKVSNFKSAA